tara:strand:+ start:42 stop:470 length:429 start_codon:yes stop_codon:yes gene_type:complete
MEDSREDEGTSEWELLEDPMEDSRGEAGKVEWEFFRSMCDGKYSTMQLSRIWDSLMERDFGERVDASVTKSGGRIAFVFNYRGKEDFSEWKDGFYRFVDAKIKGDALYEITGDGENPPRSYSKAYRIPLSSMPLDVNVVSSQ